MLDDYTRSDHWEKLKRASRRDASSRHNIPYTGKRGSADKRRWGGKVPIEDHSMWQFDQPYCAGEPSDYENEVGGLHSHQIHFRHWEGKDDGGFSHRIAERWLEKLVGRPWDDVWSDICTSYDSRSYVGQSRRETFYNKRWASGAVDLHTYVSVDGNIRNLPHRWVVDGLYVHPETGLLCNAEPAPSYKTRNRRKRFISDIVGVNKDGWFFVGEYRNSRRHRDYEYRMEDCGAYSKRPDKNKLKTWFRCWDEVTSTPYWHTHWNQGYSPFYYESFNYSWHPEYGWGEWRWNTQTVHHKKSCTKDELAWIRHALADDFPIAVLSNKGDDTNIRPRGGKRC